jgi:quercetin dioxygenase-like cupin family protein
MDLSANAGEDWLEADRFRSRPDGVSEFVRARIPAAAPIVLNQDGTSTARLSALLPSPAARLLLLPPGLSQPPHPAPEPQIVVVLKGRIEVETGDGTVKSWGPGEFFIASDHDGVGHSTRTGSEQVMLMFVPLGAADLDAWTV